MSGVEVRYSGPFFMADRDGLVRRAANATIQELVELGEQRLDQMLRPRPGGVYLSVSEAGKGRASVGHYRRSVHSEVRDLRGRIDDSKVTYGPWLEGVGSRNATTRFKGYSSFRRTAQWLQAQVPKVLRANVGRLVQQLGGR